MKSQVLHTVWYYISFEAAGQIWYWSLLGVKGFEANLGKSRLIQDMLAYSVFEKPCPGHNNHASLVTFTRFVPAERRTEVQGLVGVLRIGPLQLVEVRHVEVRQPVVDVAGERSVVAERIHVHEPRNEVRRKRDDKGVHQDGKTRDALHDFEPGTDVLGGVWHGAAKLADEVHRVHSHLENVIYEGEQGSERERCHKHGHEAKLEHCKGCRSQVNKSCTVCRFLNSYW